MLIFRIAALVLPLVAAGGLAFVFSPALRQALEQVSSVAVGPPAPTTPTTKPATPSREHEKLVEAVTGALSGPAGPSRGGDEENLPSFDVVRVDPSGDGVMAGRAAPGAVVELMRDGKSLDRAVADSSGLFVMTPTHLPAGDYELTLRATRPDGKQDNSQRGVPVAVLPNNANQPAAAPSKPSVVAAPKPPSRQPAGATVVVERVEPGPGGKLFVGARGTPGSTIRLFLNESYLASATAAADGNLSFAIGGGIGAGDYRVRLDEVDAASGAVKSRAEAGFKVPEAMAAVVSTPAPAGGASAEGAARSAPASQPAPFTLSAAPEAQPTESPTGGSSPSAVVMPKVKTALVARGDSLWRISETTYGKGIRYGVIYQANHDQIRRPNLIYPGQTFVLPELPN